MSRSVLRSNSPSPRPSPRIPGEGGAHLAPARRRFAVSPQLAVLAAVVLLECITFTAISPHFLSAENFLQVARINVELGLISLAMTLVIVTGGIDLSVGSLLGLCAVIFGKLWRDAGWSPAAAAAGAIALGILAGGLNALLITAMRIPALIVTLGTLSLFRGLAEGITRGVDNFTHFPPHFLLLGQGYLPLGVPVQLPILLIAAIFFYLLLHHGTVGRALSAIGFSPEGARHAGIAVQRKIALVYLLSGLCCGIAAIIYVARVGQAQADAGTGYELSSITAVVLGGTSIFGGRASIPGTLLGLLAIAILENGLRLAGLPPELGSVLTGVLLIVAIGAQWRPRQRPAVTASAATAAASEELDMRNSQLAVLCAAILATGLIIAGGNFVLVRSLQPAAPPPPSPLLPTPANSPNPPAPPPPPLTIAMMPKSKGNAYFIACHQGAEEAARQLNVNLLWDGPTDPDPARQNEIVETWITRGVDAIAVSVENQAGLSTVLREARHHGIKVVTFDADADTDARDWFVNQATPQGIGDTLMDDAAATMHDQGDFAIITSSLTAQNQNRWIQFIKDRCSSKYPSIHLVELRPCDDIQSKAFDQTMTVLNAHPQVKLIMAVCSPGVPGAAEAVKQSGRTDVHVVGLGLPNENKQYVHDGITTAVVLWNTMDLGYLTVYVADADKRGTLKPGATSFPAGRLGTVQVRGDNVMLGTPFTFTSKNIDRFNF